MIINKNDIVITQDGVELGTAHVLYHRDPATVNPELLWYASYLEVENLNYGDNYFVPTEYIVGHDAGTKRLILSVKFNEVLELTWTRRPDFIAHGQATVEELPAS
ncbi:MAG: hypothetical protein Fur0021_18860 [Candidatus Promineifilaceae bacterium]